MELISDATPNLKKNNIGARLKRGAFFVLGTTFLILGGIGIFLPILPTTPFLLLSVACYYKSSRRMHNWMLHNRWFGDYIRNYTEGRGISLKAKLFTLALLWVLILYSVLFVVDDLLIELLLLAIATGVTIHIAKLPTFKG